MRVKTQPHIGVVRAGGSDLKAGFVVHPSRAIKGVRSRLLEGRTIVLGVTGSIAAVEVVRIARELIRHGAEVRAVMSPEATRIITPEALAFATGTPPVMELTGGVEHVSLLGPGEGQADLLLIAPATANTISKIAHGIDDTPVTSFASMALGGGVPILVAPAMHGHMGRNPAVVENLRRLRAWGVEIVQPVAAEGEEKLASPEEVAVAVLQRLARSPWLGRKVVVVGGASREPIDEVRSVTNDSSGRMAVALAAAASHRGAKVELWAGALRVAPPPGIPVRSWRSVGDLTRLIRLERTTLASASAVLVPAALSDFTTAPRQGKIRSRGVHRMTLTLTPAPRILPRLRKAAQRPTLLVGFKLGARSTPRRLIQDARTLAEEADLDGVVANDARGLGSDMLRGWWIVRGSPAVPLQGPKEAVAGELLERLGNALPAPPHQARKPTQVTRSP